jgi:hypothetical protein
MYVTLSESERACLNANHLHLKYSTVIIIRLNGLYPPLGTTNTYPPTRLVVASFSALNRYVPVHNNGCPG